MGIQRPRGMGIQRERPRGREMGVERESKNQIKCVERKRVYKKG